MSLQNQNENQNESKVQIQNDIKKNHLQQQEQDKKKMRKKLWIVCFLMLGFGFALIPFYRAICEATGINILSRQENNEKQVNTQVDVSRKINIELDANVHGGFRFTPETKYLSVHPGEIKTVYYNVENQRDKEIHAQAIPSYAPEQSTKYFAKLECFCFKEQTFKANETKKMAVVFLINSKLPKDIHTITLSYTFFETKNQQQVTPTAAPTTSKTKI